MSDTVFEAFMEKSKDDGAYSDSPVLGQTADKEEEKLKPRIRYFVGVLTNNSDVLMLEDIMTRSMRCRDQLKEVGDVLVISETGSFDKEGCYSVVVKYVELEE